MKVSASFAAIAIAISAQPVLARDNAAYVTVDLGVSRINDAPVTATGGFGFAPNTGIVTTVESKAGYDVDLVVGYDFGRFRLEGELGYKRAANRNYTSTGFAAYETPAGNIAIVPPGSYNNVDGHQSALSGMVNGLADFGRDEGVQFSAGGGIGYASVRDSLGILPDAAILSDSNSRFAWQLLAVARVPVSQRFDVSLKYRYFNVNSVNLTTEVGTDIATKFRSHSVLIGLTYNFGGPRKD